VRPQKCLLAAVSTLLGSYLSGAHVALWSPAVVTAAITMGLVCAFGFVVNDWSDAPADGAGKPGRPIPAGLISRPAALALAASLAAAALLLASASGPLHAVVSLLLVAVGAAYSVFELKRVPLLGIATVAFLSSATVAYGGFAAGAISPATVALLVCVFLNSCALETLYTVQDLPADEQAGTRTTAVVLGRGWTLRIFHAFNALLLGALYLLPLGLGVASPPYLAAVSLLAAAPTALAGASAGLRYEPRRAARARLALRAVRVCAIAPILLLHP
jgi:geranylgeranylglycerol-phosphate geranylgeranyltransferase